MGKEFEKEKKINVVDLYDSTYMKCPEKVNL